MKVTEKYRRTKSMNFKNGGNGKKISGEESNK